ncbi:MAG: hypothetical protein ACOYZ8_09935 [Chloroflexota bacterium]
MTLGRSRRTSLSFPWCVFLAALTLRLVPVLLSRSLGIGLDDMFHYDMLARSLAGGNGFRWFAEADLKQVLPYIQFDLSAIEYDPARGVPTSFRAPLYPAFLSLIYFLVGPASPARFFAARLAQAVIGATLAPMTYFFALKLRLSLPSTLETEAKLARTARLASWTIACYPILLVYPIALATENLFFPLVLLSALTLLWAAENPSTRRFALAGLVLGLAALTRSVILPAAGLAILWIWWTQFQALTAKGGSARNEFAENLRGLRLFAVQAIRPALVTALVFLAVILPWIIRNSLLHGRLTGIESSMGYNLYLGYHPNGNGTFQFGISLDLLTILDDSVRDQIGAQRALEFIQQDSVHALELIVTRLGYFFGLERRAVTYFYSNGFLGYIPLPLLLLIAAVLLLPFMVVSTSATLGAALLRKSPQVTLLWLIVLGYLLPHALILAEDRFHLAITPFFAVIAAYFWVNGRSALAARWRESRTGKMAVSLAVLVVFLLFFNWGWELVRDADKLALLLGPAGHQTFFSY